MLRLFERLASPKARLGAGVAVFLMLVVGALVYYETRKITTQAFH